MTPAHYLAGGGSPIYETYMPIAALKASAGGVYSVFPSQINEIKQLSVTLCRRSVTFRGIDMLGCGNYILYLSNMEGAMSNFGRLTEPDPEDYPEWSRKRLEQVWSDMSVINMLKMKKPYKWPFKGMQVGDELSFYPVSPAAVGAAHAYGSSRGWKFKSFQEWPLTIIQRVS